VKHDALHYRDDVIGEHPTGFPDFIFQFKYLTKLTLHLHPEIVVPNDWSALDALSILAFSKDGPVFQNIDFLDAMPSLKYLTNMMLGKPELFLQKKHIEMRMCDVPQKVRNKQRINLPDTVISQLGNDFKKSNLPLDRQAFYLTKFLTKKLSAFTEEEIEELTVVEFSHTIKRFYSS